MKKVLLVLALVYMSLHSSWGQSVPQRGQDICGTHLDEAKLKKYNPSAYQKHIEIEQLTQEYIKRKTAKVNDQSSVQRVTDPQVTITIPVVVHVMFNTNAQNISDTQIRLQIDELNRDFRGRRTPPAEFANLAADANIEFQLACVDPNGNPTTGIRRVFTDRGGFAYRETAAGEPDEAFVGLKNLPNAAPWPRDRYLNIWTCNFVDGTLGYAQRPGSAPNVDGVAVHYRAFGSNGANLPDYNQGAVATHEVGHWLNLNHTFGADNNLCDDDGVADTPLEQAWNFGCPNGQIFSCGASTMYQNYMDYTNDACRTMFTIGQRDRMRALFFAGGPRENFISAKIQQQDAFLCGPAPYVFSVSPPEVPGVNFNWSVSGGLMLSSGQGSNQITCMPRIPGEGGYGFITVSANGYCETRTVTFGVPNFSNGDIINNDTGQRTYLGAGNTVPENTTVQFPYEEQTTYYFEQIGGGYGYITRAYDQEFDLYMPYYADMLTVRITKTNPCGTLTQEFQFFPEYYYRYSPNPASDELVVEAVVGKETKPAVHASAFDATLYDNYGHKIKTEHSKQGKAKLDVRSLPSGLYNLRVGEGKRAISEHIQITH